jgi:hypothetical protein
MQALAFRAIAAIAFPNLFREVVSAVAIVILQCFEQTLRYGTAAIQENLA